MIFFLVNASSWGISSRYAAVKAPEVITLNSLLTVFMFGYFPDLSLSALVIVANPSPRVFIPGRRTHSRHLLFFLGPVRCSAGTSIWRTVLMQELPFSVAVQHGL